MSDDRKILSGDKEQQVDDLDARVVIILDNGNIITGKSVPANDFSPPVIPLSSNLGVLGFGQRFRGD